MPRPVKPIERVYARALYRLFLRDPESSVRPLFSSLTELADTVRDLPDGDYAGRSGTPSFLNQVLRGQKPCPAHLQDCLKRVALPRVQQSAEMSVRQWLDEFERALEEVKAGRQVRRDRSLGNPKIEATRSTFIICPFFAAGRSTANGRKMVRHFLAIHGLTGQNIHPSVPAMTYTFCFTGDTEAEALWTTLLRESLLDDEGQKVVPAPKELEQRLSIVVEHLQHLESRQRLRAMILPSNLCLLPVALYDIGEAKAKGVVMMYEGDTHYSVPILTQYLPAWRRLIAEIESGTMPGIRHVTFDHVRTRLKANLRGKVPRIETDS